MLTNIDMELPGRKVLWEIVQEARDYLHQWIEDPNSRYYGDMAVDYDPLEWGARTSDGRCIVCLAGLWYLRKMGILLDDVLPDLPALPSVADFLDEMRHLNPRDLGIDIDIFLEARRELINQLLGDGVMWDSNNPKHHLLFMDWLLKYRGILQPNEAIPNAK